MAIRQLLVKTFRNTPLEGFAMEVDERLFQVRGAMRGTYSQHGEDRVILDYFGGRPGIYVDVGANYPVKISNTYLLYRHGWRGLTVEPIPRLAKRHRRLRPRDVVVNAAVGEPAEALNFYEFDIGAFSTFDEERKNIWIERGMKVKQVHCIPIKPLDELVSQSLKGEPVDFLSVDTEGFDLQVLHSANWQTFRPKLIIFEADEKADTEGMLGFLRDKDYSVWREIGCNMLMERNE